MKKRYLAVVLGAALFSSGFGGTTYSDFYSEASSAGNKIEMGTLKISPFYENPSPLFIGFSKTTGNKVDGYWYPGKKTETKQFITRNVGSVKAIVKNAAINIHSIKGVEDVKAAEESFNKNLKFTIRTNNGVAFKGTLAELKNKPTLKNTSLLNPIQDTHDTDEVFTITAELSRQAGNEIQGAKVDFDLTMYAGQE
ncbi:hypothetical protein [Rossellomorea marisflavi]|uniref:hypothetical protein n=1 Tax=Rossellomorea marisflavi TaxID=189381 RepID=UPI001EE2A5B7|nr:hypothetical protein [Rossellomorea marisflavi]UKS64964.1 hypothetical protein K6T23_19880 [Rossellomorea marisflavi]